MPWAGGFGDLEARAGTARSPGRHNRGREALRSFRDLTLAAVRRAPRVVGPGAGWRQRIGRRGVARRIARRDGRDAVPGPPEVRGARGPARGTPRRPRAASPTSCSRSPTRMRAAYAACAFALKLPREAFADKEFRDQPDPRDREGRRRGPAALRRALPRRARARRGARGPLEHERVVGPAGRRAAAPGRRPRRRRERPREPAADRHERRGPRDAEARVKRAARASSRRSPTGPRRRRRAASDRGPLEAVAELCGLTVATAAAPRARRPLAGGSRARRSRARSASGSRPMSRPTSRSTATRRASRSSSAGAARRRWSTSSGSSRPAPRSGSRARSSTSRATTPPAQERELDRGDPAPQRRPARRRDHRPDAAPAGRPAADRRRRHRSAQGHRRHPPAERRPPAPRLRGLRARRRPTPRWR